jgi:predicted  nucleic acid-binding Zn-ribbon protein
VHPHVKKLIELQRIDQEIASLRRDTDSLPGEEAKRRRRLEDSERGAQEKKERATKGELDARALEKAIRQADEEIKKLTERLNVVRNNAEYQATLFQIEAVKKDRDQTQEDCLRILESLEALKQEADAAAKAAAEERSVLDQFLAEADRLRKTRQVEVDAVLQRRRVAVEDIPPDVLSDYERLFATRDGLAVCAVEGGYCQGCYNRITTNDTARLRGGSVVVQCGSCQRILYLAR